MAGPRTPAPQRPLVPLWIAVWLAAVAGLLMSLAFPSMAIWPLGPVAVAMVLICLDGRRLWAALLVGGVYGLVFFSLLVSWTARYLGPVPWVALAVVEGVLTGVSLLLVALAYRWVPRVWPRARPVLLPAVVAALWTVHELFLGNWPYGGFPWARLGMTQADGPFARVASWVGVSGLSFLLVFVVALLVECVRQRFWRRPVVLVAPVVTALVLLILPQFPTAHTGSMRIAAVQGNGPTGYFDHREQYSVIDAQMKATEPLKGQKADLIVWPEGGVDYDPFQDAPTARRLSRVVSWLDAPLLANTATERGKDIFNTSFLWTKQGTATQLHDKRHPVPFGEYVPDRAFYNALAPDLIGLIGREYTPGTNPPYVKANGVGVGLAICFDVIYDDVIWDGADDGAQVYMFQTNNADFRGTDENLQQLAFARMRAIETGRSVVNISTVGTSQIMRPDGSTQATLKAGEAGALLENVELRSGLTAGVVLGPWLQLLLVVTGLGSLVVSGVIARRRR